MSLHSKVAWKDGMFLLPQHFQQAERNFESMLRQRTLGPQPLQWGVLELAINETALAEGRVELTLLPRCGQMGWHCTPQSWTCCPPPRPYRRAARRARWMFSDHPGSSPASSPRWRCRPSARMLATSSARSKSPMIKIRISCGRLTSRSKIRGLCSDVRRSMASWCSRSPSWNGRSKGPDASSRLRPAHADGRGPPLLSKKLQELLSRANARADELTAQRRLRDRPRVQRRGPAELLLLHTLNTQLTRLRHLLTVPGIHPERLYEGLLSLFARCWSFHPMRCGRPLHTNTMRSASASRG